MKEESLTPDQIEDLASRRTKRAAAIWAFRIVCAVDVALIAAALAFPQIAAMVGKLEFLVATLNGFCGAVVAAYMGFSYQAQWRRNSYPTTYPGSSPGGYSPSQYGTSPGVLPPSPYGR